MTLQRFVLSAIASITTIAVPFIAAAQTPSFAATSVTVDYHPERNSYDIYADSFFRGSVVAPDGTIFGDEFPLDDLVADLSESSLISRFAGTWKLLSTQPPSPAEYQFSVTGEQLSAKGTTPEILTPVDGAHLPDIFDIQHTGAGHIVSGTTADGRGRFFSSGPGGHVDESGRLPDRYPLSATGWAFNYNEVVLGPATQINGASREMIVSVVSRSLSTPRSWTVGVPEPTSMLMASSGCFALVALRRRK